MSESLTQEDRLWPVSVPPIESWQPTQSPTQSHTHKDIPKSSRNYSSDFPSQHADWVLKIKITSFQLLLSDAVSISRIKVASKWPQNQQQCLQHSYILLRWTWLGNDSSRESTRRWDLYIFVLFCSVYDSQSCYWKRYESFAIHVSEVDRPCAIWIW